MPIANSTIAALEQTLQTPIPTVDPHDEIASAFATHGHLAPAGTTCPFVPGQSGSTPLTLATMPRWVEIHFDRRLANEIGRNGIAISTSKLFDWLSGDVDLPEDQAEYYQKLARALSDDETTPPVIENWSDNLVDRLKEAARLSQWASIDEVGLSAPSVGHLAMYANAVLFDALVIGGYSKVEVGYPEDLLPPWIAPGETVGGVVVPVGLVLTFMSEEIEGENPVLASRLRRAVDAHYPDQTVVIDVGTPEGDRFLVLPSCTELSRYFQHPNGAIEYVPGSIDVKNYVGVSQYSPEDDRYPYRIFRYWDDEGEEMCLLVSDRLVLQASVHRDDV